MELTELICEASVVLELKTETDHREWSIGTPLLLKMATTKLTMADLQFVRFRILGRTGSRF